MRKLWIMWNSNFQLNKKVITHNFKNQLGNNYIYIITVSILSFIMLFSFEISSNTHENIETKSFTIILLIIMFAILNYLNTYILKSKYKEIAYLNLIGIKLERLISINFLERMAMNTLCLLLSSIINIVFYKIITVKMELICFFLFIEIYNTLILYYKVRKKPLIDLLKKSKVSECKENKKSTKVGRRLLITILIYLISIFTIFNDRIAIQVKVLTVSLSVVPTAYLVYYYYLYILNKLENRRSYALTNKMKIYDLISTTNILSGNNKFKLYYILTIAYIISVLSYIIGIIFLNSRNILIKRDYDKIMGIYQIILSFIFLIIIITIFMLNHITDTYEIIKTVKEFKKIGLSDKCYKKVVRKCCTEPIKYMMYISIGITFITLAIANHKFLKYILNINIMKYYLIFILTTIILLYIYLSCLNISLQQGKIKK